MPAVNPARRVKTLDGRIGWLIHLEEIAANYSQGRPRSRLVATVKFRTGDQKEYPYSKLKEIDRG
jgi:hypothetical protein